MSDRKATILIDGEHPIELPIHKGTLGQDVIDVGTLGNHGYFTYDPSFTATASCRSEITYIDGNNYYGEEYHSYKSKSVEATNWWNETFFKEKIDEKSNLKYVNNITEYNKKEMNIYFAEGK